MAGDQRPCLGFGLVLVRSPPNHETATSPRALLALLLTVHAQRRIRDRFEPLERYVLAAAAARSVAAGINAVQRRVDGQEQLVLVLEHADSHLLLEGVRSQVGKVKGDIG